MSHITELEDNMNLDAFKDKDCDVLVRHGDRRYMPIFKKYNKDKKRAIYRYLFSRKPKKLPPSLKNRLINLYDPLADRSSRFPDGLRWCLNVYVGCVHNCGYCYVNGYSQDSVGISPHAKVDFNQKLMKDLQALISLGVPPAPLHMSNSTDPLQEKLEVEHHHTLLALQKILQYRKQFTSVVMLTKNPRLLATEPYLSVIGCPELQPFTVQVTCPYWNDTARLFFEPKAPSIENRLEAVRFVTGKGIDVELRIDPLFPSSRIEAGIRLHKPLSHYSLPEAQSEQDILTLVRFAKEANVSAIIAKPLKVPVSGRAKRCKDWFLPIYTDASNGRRTVKGASWRLPEPYQKALVSKLSTLCAQERIQFRHCMQDVLSRK